MTPEDRVTYCRICEPLCGMVATVEDGRLTKLRPDSEHPLSQGFACPKGIAMAEVHNDPDRVLHPLRRNARGEFERVGWDEALDEIGARLKRIVDEHGGDSVGYYMGNPAAFSYSHPLWAKGFVDAFGSPHFYTASSQDVSNRFAASPFLYGSPVHRPDPGPGPDRLPPDRRRQPAGLARQRHERAAGEGPAPRDHRARRARGGRRPAALGDRARVRARRDPSGRRRLPSALDARGDLLRRARGRGGDRATVPRRRRPARAGDAASRRADGGPHRGRGARGAPSRPRPRPRRARGRLRAHRLVPRPQRDRGLVPARRAQPGHREPRPRGRCRVRRSAGRLRAAGVHGRTSRRTTGCARGSATSPRCWAACRRR